MLDLNVSPFFDDFDALKNFHQILFRPGFPVQSRELTQIQSMLQNQLKKFGDHIFKNGSMVIPGNTRFDTNVSSVRLTLDDPDFDVQLLVGENIHGSLNNVAATVTLATKTGASAVLYCKTFANSDTTSSVSSFENSEELVWDSDAGDVVLGTTDASSAVQPATLASINEGIYYVNGFFVTVHKQTVVVSSTSATPTSTVGLAIVEDIFTESDDVSLLDPAAGTSNENAPGAHRYKITLELQSYDDVNDLPPDFIVLAKMEAGVLVKLVDQTVYSELMKTIARRTYEESGNYVVRDYVLKLQEQNPESAFLDLFASQGISFVGGYENNNTNNRMSAVIAKGRTSKVVQNSLLRTNFGNYFYVASAFGLPRTWSYIELRDETVSTPGTAAGNIVGFAKVRAVEKTAITGIYKVFVFDAEYNVGKSVENVASIVEFNSAGAAARTTANVVTVYTTANVAGTFNTTENIVAQGAAGREVVPVSVDTTNKLIYAVKRSGAYSWLKSGDTVKQNVTNATALISSLTVVQEPLAAVPILKYPKAAVKTASDFVYQVNRQIPVTLNGSGAGNFTLPAGETFTDVSKAVAWVAATGAFVAGLTISEGSNSFSIAGGPASAAVTVQTIVKKTTATYKSKTLTSGNVVIADPSKMTMISLGEADVLRVTSITQGAVDLTSRYVLRKNQSDGIIETSYVELAVGESLPAASAMTINFEYLLNSTGDFATVDSYSSLAAGDAFVEEIPTFTSSFGEEFRLEDVIDFRPAVRDRVFSVVASTTAANPTVTLSSGYSNGLLSTTAGYNNIYGPGMSNTTLNTIASISVANGTQFNVTNNPSTTNSNAVYLVGFDGATYSAVESGSAEPIAAVGDFLSDYEFYLGRYDTVCVTNAGELEVFTGVASENPVPPLVQENELRMKLADLYIPPYTFNTADIISSKYNRRRYTMADIAILDSRISTLEDMMTLSLLEQELASTQIIDPNTGLNRFKSGFIVDNFRDHSVVDMTADTIANLDYTTSTLSALKDSAAMNLMVIASESSNYVVKDRVAMLPYTEVALVDQQMATRPQNINPFAVFRWNGTVRLTPGSDFWTETRRLGDINVTNSVTVWQ